MKRIKAVLAGVGLVSTLWVVVPGAASACDLTNPCGYGNCHVNEQGVSVDDEGHIYIGPERPIECAW